MSTKVIVASTVEPILLADAKDYLRVTDDANNATITRIIKSARRTCENVLGMAIASQTYQSIVETDRPLVGHLGGTRGQSREIFVPMSPVQSFLSVTDPTTGNPTASIYYEDHYRVWNVMPANYLDIDLDSVPAIVTTRYGAFTTAFLTREYTHRVKLTYIAGYSDFSLLSENILEAMYMLIMSYFDDRDGAAMETGAMCLLNQERINLI